MLPVSSTIALNMLSILPVFRGISSIIKSMERDADSIYASLTTSDKGIVKMASPHIPTCMRHFSQPIAVGSDRRRGSIGLAIRELRTEIDLRAVARCAGHTRRCCRLSGRGFDADLDLELVHKAAGHRPPHRNITRHASRAARLLRNARTGAGAWFNKVSAEEYFDLYTEQLVKLDPQRTVDRIAELGCGADVALLCFEAPHKPEATCHRAYVSAWLHDALGLEIREFTLPRLASAGHIRSCRRNTSDPESRMFLRRLELRACALSFARAR